jgi:SAM-dependent methyltransferase
MIQAPTTAVFKADGEDYFSHSRPEIAAEVPVSALSILDVGCGTGRLGERLRREVPGRTVTGIELDAAAAQEAARVLDSVHQVDVEAFEVPFATGQFDCIILADILEHLNDPWAATHRLLDFLRPGGTLIVSLPNIRNIEVMRGLLHDGRWEYQDEGILDRTHLRFFTRRQFLGFLGTQDIACQRITYLGEVGPDTRFTGSMLVNDNITIHDLEPEEVPELCATQLVYTGVYRQSRPGPAAGSPEVRLLFPPPCAQGPDGVAFGPGFFEDDNGRRWVGPEGVFHVHARLLLPGQAVSFQLACPNLAGLSSGALTTRIYYNDMLVETVDFSGDTETATVRLSLYPGLHDACIRLVSSDCAIASAADARMLSVLCSGLTVAPAAEGAVESIRFTRGFHAQENGTRWMGPEGELQIASGQLLPGKTLSLRVASPRPGKAPAAAQTVSVFYNDVPVQSFTFGGSRPEVTLRMPLHPGRQDARIRFAAGSWFRPSDAGGSTDSRRLSLLFRGVEILS